MKTKKIASLVSAAVIGAVTLCPTFTANAQFQPSTNTGILLNAEEQQAVDIFMIGDNTMNTASFVNDSLNKGASELLSTYYSKTVTNKCLPSVTTSQLKSAFGNIKNFAADQTELVNFSKAEIIVLSLGTEDILETIRNVIKKNYPAIYDEKDIFGSLLRVANTLSKSQSSETDFAALIATLNTELGAQMYDTIENYDYIISQLKAFNPGAKLVVQTVYNPLLLSKDEIDTLLSGKPKLYSVGYTTIKNLLAKHIETLNDGIINQIGQRAIVVDSASAFADGDTGYGFSGLYTNVLDDNHDYSLNAVGNIVVANEIIRKLGCLDNRDISTNMTAYYSNVYCDIPAKALDAMCKTLDIVRGDFDGDGVVDAADASAALAIYSKIQTGSSFYEVATSANLIALDIDLNKTVDASDASTILAHYSNVQTGGKGLF